jgi:hypothetical protein
MSWFAYLPSMFCAFSALYLANRNKEGWGWFLLAAVLLVPLFKSFAG